MERSVSGSGWKSRPYRPVPSPICSPLFLATQCVLAWSARLRTHAMRYPILVPPNTVGHTRSGREKGKPGGGRDAVAQAFAKRLTCHLFHMGKHALCGIFMWLRSHSQTLSNPAPDRRAATTTHFQKLSLSHTQTMLLPPLCLNCGRTPSALPNSTHPVKRQ